jgi:hypothetical protein
MSTTSTNTPTWEVQSQVFTHTRQATTRAIQTATSRMAQDGLRCYGACAANSADRHRALALTRESHDNHNVNHTGDVRIT